MSVSRHARVLGIKTTSLCICDALKCSTRETRPRPVRMPVLADWVTLESDKEEERKVRQRNERDQAVEKEA